MSAQTPPPFLPPEIIIHIINSLVPPPAFSPIAYPPSHPVTATLLALTQTSRVTYLPALRLLYARCLYINTPRRLHSLVRTLSTLSAPTTTDVPSPSAAAASLQQRQSPRTLPPSPLLLSHLTSLYLAPYPLPTINDLPLTTALHMLLTHLAPSLTRLVLSLPHLHDFSLWDDANDVRLLLWRALAQLEGLEVFCSVRDEVMLEMYGWPPRAEEVFVWARWARLKVLAVYGVEGRDWRFWRALGRLGCLETLVLTRGEVGRRRDVAGEVGRARCGKEAERVVRVVMVDVEGQHREMVGREGWKDVEGEGERDGDGVMVRVVDVPVPSHGPVSHCEPEYFVRLCHEWVERRMMGGKVGGADLTWLD